MVQINFQAGENTGGGAFEPLPEGTGLFEIESYEVGSSKNEKPQLELSLKILDGPREGGTCKNWYSLVPTAGWNLRGLLDALGIEYESEGQDKEGRDDIVFDGDDLVGRQVEYYVKQREYNGRINNDFVNPRDPDYVEEEDEGKSTAAPEPEPAPPKPAPNSGRRRRPRPSR